MIARGRFTMIPECLDDFKLSPVAFALYYAYKSVCGEDAAGRCWKTRANLAERVGVSVPTLDKAYKELLRKGLIESDKVRWAGGRYRVVVRIVDIWAKNEQAPKRSARTIRNGEHARVVRQPSNSTAETQPVFVASPCQNSLQRTVKDFAPRKKPDKKKSNYHSSSSEELKSVRCNEGCGATGERSVGKTKRVVGNSTTIKQRRGCTHMRGFELEESKQKAETYDDKAARKLIDAVAGKMRLMRRADVAVWSKDIKSFRDKNGVSEEDFEDILCWYIKHIGDQFIPMVHSAKSFCEKIDQIGLARRRVEIEQRGATSKSNYDGQLERLKSKGVCK